MFDARVAWQQVRENLAKLDACEGPHVFEALPAKDAAFTRAGTTDTYRCKLCEGELNHYGVVWYRRGQQHGKGAE